MVILAARFMWGSLVFLGEVCWILMGKQAKGMKRESGRGGFEYNGPLLKAKSTSLKVASQAMKKEVVPPMCMEVSWSGSSKKMHAIGRIERRLEIAVVEILVAVWQ